MKYLSGEVRREKGNLPHSVFSNSLDSAIIHHSGVIVQQKQLIETQSFRYFVTTQIPVVLLNARSRRWFTSVMASSRPFSSAYPAELITTTGATYLCEIEKKEIERSRLDRKIRRGFERKGKE